MINTCANTPGYKMSHTCCKHNKRQNVVIFLLKMGLLTLDRQCGNRRKYRRQYYPKFFIHDDVIKWKHFPRYWPFVRGIHRSPVNSPHKGQWRGALMFPLICARINGWVNNREAGNLRSHRAHYDVTVICMDISPFLLYLHDTGLLVSPCGY